MTLPYRSFSWKDTNLKVAGSPFDLITAAIVEARRQLERYIQRQPRFKDSLSPVALLTDAPEVACRMAAAAQMTGLGPMAAVAGTLAQIGVEAAMAAGSREAIVDNGGDLYVLSTRPVTIGIYAGENAVGSSLAFRLDPTSLPLAICSSSSRMGHSHSLGQCDLATVVAREGALADAAVTLVGNRIVTVADLGPTLEAVGAIAGVEGILAVKDGQIGLWGNLPPLVRNWDHRTRNKVTRDLDSDFHPPFGKER
jgi:uncharacterized protein